MSTLPQSPDRKGGVPANPLIDEVRTISEQFGNDADRLRDHLQELERQHPERLVEPAAPPEDQTTRGQRE